MDVTSTHGRSEEINPYRTTVQASAVGDGGLELWPSGEGKSPQICCLARDRRESTSEYMLGLGPENLPAPH